MANSILSAKVKRILSNHHQCRTLGQTLMDMDEKRKCDYEDSSVKAIHTGIRSIARSLKIGVQKLDPQFEGDLFGTGSFYDRLKVGVVDEFDFMLELKSLSGDNDLTFLDSEPGFANILITGAEFGKWPTTVYCLTHKFIANAETRKDCGSRCENTVKVLDASAVQGKFRKLTDEVLKRMPLPQNFEHGGFLRPQFGGFRKHGPATLYQFVWKAPDGHAEIKVNIDMTLSIKIPTPTNTKPFQLDIFRRFPKSNSCVSEITSNILNDPGLAIIPLYSNFMIATGKADKKYSWKVSCSRVEQLFLSSFSDQSLLKTLIRVLKIIRDDHLTYHRRKTKRSKRKCKTKRRQQKPTDKADDSEECGNLDELIDFLGQLTHDTEQSIKDVDDNNLSVSSEETIKDLLDDIWMMDMNESEDDTLDLDGTTHSDTPIDNRVKPHATMSDQGDEQTNIERRPGNSSHINMKTGDILPESRHMDGNLSKDTPTEESREGIKEAEEVVHRHTEADDVADIDEKPDCDKTHPDGFETSSVHTEHNAGDTNVIQDTCDQTRNDAQKHDENQPVINMSKSDEPTIDGDPSSNLIGNHTNNDATTDDKSQSNSLGLNYLKTEGNSGNVSPPDETGMSLPTLAVSMPATNQHVPHEGETTDLTEVEELTALEYQAKFRDGHTKYQKYDIGQERVTPEPGSGEYYGPRQYISSVEIKFMAMNFVLGPDEFPEIFKRDAEPESLARYVLSSLENFRNIFDSGKSTRSLYFPAPACTPLSAEKRQRVVSQIATIVDDLEKEARKLGEEDEYL